MASTICEKLQQVSMPVLVIRPLVTFYAILEYDEKSKMAWVLECMRVGNDIHDIALDKRRLDYLPRPNEMTKIIVSEDTEEWFINNNMNHFIIHSVDYKDKAVPPENQTEVITEHVKVTKKSDIAQNRFESTLLPSYLNVGCWCQQIQLPK